MYLSSLIGRPARGVRGDDIGKLRDLVARLDDDSRPAVTGAVVSVQRRDLFVPLDEIASLAESGLTLATSRLDIRPFQRRDGEILLGRDLLDKKVVDLSRGRVARANDIRLDAETWRVVSVDVGVGAVAKRIGFGWLARGRREVPWEQVDVFASSVPGVQLDLQHRKIARLHPSDIATIMDDLPSRQRQEIVEALTDDQAADAVEDMDPRSQAVMVQSMDSHDAADLLEAMGDDAAADVLGDLAPDRAEEILAHMDADDAAAVRSLLGYDDDTAGGMMTTEFVSLSPATPAGDVLPTLRAAEWAPDFISMIYLLDEDGVLNGVVDLRDVIFADPDAPIANLARRELVVGSPDDDPAETARTIARYNLFALPIVDEAGGMLGIVTVDDAIDVLAGIHRSRRIFG